VWDAGFLTLPCRGVTACDGMLAGVLQMPPDFNVVYESVQGEVVVAGVFLRLLIKQPNWAFRKPKEFLTALTVFATIRAPSPHHRRRPPHFTTTHNTYSNGNVRTGQVHFLALKKIVQRGSLG
jgi:hypothetical protein